VQTHHVKVLGEIEPDYQRHRNELNGQAATVTSSLERRKLDRKNLRLPVRDVSKRVPGRVGSSPRLLLALARYLRARREEKRWETSRGAADSGELSQPSAHQAFVGRRSTGQ
jgi:hypothetical protein